MLQVRPDLTWRDLQYLTMDTALPIEGDEANQQDTAIGKKFSHTFGYGKIDSWALVEKAKDWELVKPQAWFFSPWIHVKKSIPEGRDGLSVTFKVTKDMIKDANIARLEHVTVTMNVKHQRRGDLSVDLISPENVVSHLAACRDMDSKEEGFVDWTFMSVVHWYVSCVLCCGSWLTWNRGESGVGKWTIVVRDTQKNNYKGKFIDWRLKLWGEAIDADKATKLPMPDVHDDDDHDKIVETTTLPASTTSATSHPERPTPTTTEEASPSGTEEAPQETTTSSSSWISWLPTFGASKQAQIWIYGAIGLISAFCVGLGVYFWIARRRRLRNSSRNNYEFELLDDEEAEGLNSGEKAAGAKPRRTRGGELYDAFAEGSDDEQFEDYRDNRDQSTDRLADDDTEHYAVGDDSDESDDEKAETRPLGGGR